MEYSNFSQSLKVPKWVNCIKGEFAQYYKNSAFDILTDPFVDDNLPITNRFLWYILYLFIKNITDNIYHYCNRYCNNGWTQMKGINFE